MVIVGSGDGLCFLGGDFLMVFFVLFLLLKLNFEAENELSMKSSSLSILYLYNVFLSHFKIGHQMSTIK